jgi:hypothetical protein
MSVHDCCTLDELRQEYTAGGATAKGEGYFLYSSVTLDFWDTQLEAVVIL